MSKSKKYKGLKKAVLNYNNFGHIGITIYFNPKKGEILTNMDKLQLQEMNEKDLIAFMNSKESSVSKLSMQDLENIIAEKGLEVEAFF